MFSVVEALIREHEQLLSLAQRKKEVLIKGDMEALNVIVKEEVAFIHRIERLEAERMALGRLLAVRLQVSVEQVTASRLLELAVDAEEKQGIKALTDRLRNVFEELKSLNDL